MYHRSIRLMNPNFHSKIASIDGGLETMLCAGFMLLEDPNVNIESKSETIGEDVDTTTVFLRHVGYEDIAAETKLQYVLLR